MATLSDQAYEKIKEMILEAEPGTFFSVRKCANDLNCSYTPTREALLRLHAEGMLKLVPKVGFFTVQMDLRDLTDIYQSRECVEQYVLPKVLPYLTEKDIQHLWEQVDIQEKALEQGDSNQYSDADVEFHSYLVNLLNNKRLSEFYQNIRSQSRVASNSVITDHSQKPVEEHKQFMHFVEERNYEAALQVLQQHIRDAIKRMQEGYIRIGL